MSDWKPMPGETPLDDISGLKIKSVKTRAALHIAEAENIRRVIIKYLAAKPSGRVAPFTLSWVKKIHGEMFGRVWIWAGEIRTRELNLGVPPEQVETSLFSLIEDLKFWETHSTPMIEQAAMLHHRAVAIHPFLNGNGRWARMLADIWLRLHELAVINWPEETLGDESVIRQEYLAAIRAADGGDYAPLFAMHARLISDP